MDGLHKGFHTCRDLFYTDVEKYQGILYVDSV